ncbi:rhodanese-like domain-containing protein [Micromonospora sp. M12]
MVAMSGPQEPLVEVDRLVAELDHADPPTLLDVRWRLTGPPGHDDYLAGHLPGRSSSTWTPRSAGARRRRSAPCPTRALQAALRAAGVRADHPVVVYDGGDGLPPRAWWTLRWAGHRSVRLLHGGYPAWVAAGRPSRPTRPHRPPETWWYARWPPGARRGAGRRAGRRDRRRAAGRTDRASLPGRGGADRQGRRARAGSGEPARRRVRRPGRPISGADLLRERFASAGVTGERAVGAYCGSG